jgi:glycerol-3-phosphate acyltransferase PlsY
MLGEAALIIGAYLLGSAPFMLVLARSKGFDLSKDEDLHFALWHKVGRREGLMGILFDFFVKGVLTVLVGFWLGFNAGTVVWAGVAAVAGQMWPVFRRFDGERGNTVGMGVMSASTLAYHAYWVFVVAAVLILAGIFIRTIPRFLTAKQTLKEKLKFGGPMSKSMPIGMAAGFAATPLVSWLTDEPNGMTWAYLAMFAIIILVRRPTVNLAADLKGRKISVARILLNRLLLDRGFV